MKYLSFDIGIKNLGIVKMIINDDNIDIQLCYLLDLTNNKKIKKITFDHLLDKLFEELEKIDVSDIDIILIENQPALMNPVCKSISVALYSFFKLKSKDVKFVSAIRKLGKEGKKLSYKEKKDQAVIQCFKLISPANRQLIQDLPRQHDIADAILQAYNYHINKCV